MDVLWISIGAAVAIVGSALATAWAQSRIGAAAAAALALVLGCTIGVWQRPDPLQPAWLARPILWWCWCRSSSTCLTRRMESVVRLFSTAMCKTSINGAFGGMRDYRVLNTRLPT